MARRTRSQKKLERMQASASRRRARERERTAQAIGTVATYVASGYVGDRIARDEQKDPTKLFMTIGGRTLPRYEILGGGLAAAGLFVKSLSPTTRMLMLGVGGGVAGAQRAVRSYQFRIENPLP